MSRKDSGYERPGFYSHWGNILSLEFFLFSRSKDENTTIGISVRMWKTLVLILLLVRSAADFDTVKWRTITEYIVLSVFTLFKRTLIREKKMALLNRETRSQIDKRDWKYYLSARLHSEDYGFCVTVPDQ